MEIYKQIDIKCPWCGKKNYCFTWSEKRCKACKRYFYIGDKPWAVRKKGSHVQPVAA